MNRDIDVGKCYTWSQRHSSAGLTCQRVIWFNCIAGLCLLGFVSLCQMRVPFVVISTGGSFYIPVTGHKRKKGGCIMCAYPPVRCPAFLPRAPLLVRRS